MSSTDFVLMYDLSGSFSDDLPNVQSLGEFIVETVTDIDDEAQVAVASFVDKPESPFGASGDFVYTTNQALTSSSEEVLTALNGLSILNGDDLPEAQLEALLQATLRDEELGYRDDSTRYVMVFTDAPFHIAGDGLLASPPITLPNNGDAIVDIDEDYPSLDQLKTALEENNIIPIFAVTPDVRESYDTLISDLERGAVVNLTSDSTNLTDAIRLGFAVDRGEVTILGTISIDILVGTSGADGIFGDLGDDIIFGRRLDDLLDGGAGDDVIRGQSGDDTIRGGTDRDRLFGGSDDDDLDGDLGDDRLRGDGGDDGLDGGEGDDRIGGDGGDDDLDGDLGDDRLRGDGGDDGLDGGEGDDRIRGGSGDDIGVGDEGDDRILGEDGDDRLNGGGSDDILRGGDDDDILLGSNGKDILVGGVGNDIVRGGRGRDVLVGVDPTADAPGTGEFDILLSGSDKDLYILGNRRGVFYDDGVPGEPMTDDGEDAVDSDSDDSTDTTSRGLDDYALIDDFNLTQDTIQLFGTSTDYILEEITLDISEGVGIFWTGDGGSGELIGVIQDGAIADLSLDNTSQFQYVG